MEKNKKSFVSENIVLISFALLAVVNLSYVYLTGFKDSFYYFLTPILSCFAAGKLFMTMFFYQGWKTLNKKMVTGLPVIIFCAYLFLATILFILWKLSFQLGAETGRNVQSLVFAFFSGLMMSAVAWFAGLKKSTALCSEYEVRQYFTKKQWSKRNIDQLIINLKEDGIIAK